MRGAAPQHLAQDNVVWSRDQRRGYAAARVAQHASVLVEPHGLRHAAHDESRSRGALPALDGPLRHFLQLRAVGQQTLQKLVARKHLRPHALHRESLAHAVQRAQHKRSRRHGRDARHAHVRAPQPREFLRVRLDVSVAVPLVDVCHREQLANGVLDVAAHDGEVASARATATAATPASAPRDAGVVVVVVLGVGRGCHRSGGGAEHAAGDGTDERRVEARRLRGAAGERDVTHVHGMRGVRAATVRFTPSTLVGARRRAARAAAHRTRLTCAGARQTTTTQLTIPP